MVANSTLCGADAQQSHAGEEEGGHRGKYFKEPLLPRGTTHQRQYSATAKLVVRPHIRPAP